MTRKEMSQLYYLNREIERDKMRLAELEAAATSVTPKITGLPHIGSVSNKTAIAAEIADLRTIIDARVRMCVAMYNRINRYIATIDDSLMRQIITLRYIEGLPWHQVAAHIGGNNTADSVKKMCYRFLK